MGDSIATKADGPELLLYGQVTDKAGKPLPNALVQVWQTDSKGEYDMQKYHGEQMDMRGNFRCDAEGRFHFRTVMPLGYFIPMDGPVGATDPGAAAPWLPARAHPLPDRRRRLPRTGHGDLSRR